MSAGQLRLIRDASILSALVEYYEVDTRDQAGRFLRPDRPYRTTVRSLTPSSMTSYIWDNRHDEDEVLEQYLVACEAPISDDEARAVLDDYLASPELLQQLRSWMSELSLAMRVTDIFVSDAERLAARIEAAAD